MEARPAESLRFPVWLSIGYRVSVDSPTQLLVLASTAPR